LASDVGVTVESGTSVAVGGNTNTSVGTKVGSGVDVSGIQPKGVGVEYCPHKDAFPTHDERMNIDVKNKK